MGLFEYFAAPEGDPTFVQSTSSMAARKVLEWLNYADVRTIEIEGDLGMESTRTARHVRDNVIESNLFDAVIWVDVAMQHCNRSNMLRQIVNQLKLTSVTENKNDEEETQNLLKPKIFEFLEEKRYFVILHDIRLFFSTDRELIDRYLLSRSDDKDHVIMHDSLRDRQHYVLEKGSDVILASPELRIEGANICLMDGDLKAKYSESAEITKPSTLLLYVDGGRQQRGIPDLFFPEMHDLEVIVILHNGIIPSSLSSLDNLDNLHILVLRDCGTPDNLDYFTGLKQLEALDISGTSTLREIPDNFFNHMTNLKTLNLSGTEIEHFPSSLSNIWRLEFLGLRGCSYLKSLPRIEELCSLIVIDLSDCTAFKGFQDESFGQKPDLHTLDLSRTQVMELQVLPECLNLHRLLLRDCLHLKRVPKLEALIYLLVLDLSGTGAEVLQSISRCSNLESIFSN
ncbi:hypothetical protein GIB67_003012 [Kingdonia uniflora]|uniref:NB-ARC domain-containing protein n=1 Tax=Kingdonia uniflora TaxID=39325 RepID=A0A7J7LYF4_9MAGN|nr:hypothetical protein GIB67_003012 [Kingdonia uniflora]